MIKRLTKHCLCYLILLFMFFALNSQATEQWFPFKIALPTPGQMNGVVIEPTMPGSYGFYCLIPGIFIQQGSINVMMDGEEKQFNMSNNNTTLLFPRAYMSGHESLSVIVISSATLKYSAGSNSMVHCDYVFL